MKFVEIDKKEYYQDFSGEKREALLENAEIDFKHISFLRDEIEENFDKIQKEVVRMDKIRSELLHRKYCNSPNLKEESSE